MSLKPFEIEQAPDSSGAAVLVLTGNMTMGAQLQYLETVVDSLAKDGHKRIVIDMSGVSYIDSTALGTLVSCHGRVKKSGGEFRLAALCERVAKIIKIGGVESIFHIDPTRDAAVAGLPPRS